MRRLVSLLAVGLVLASCEQSSQDGTVGTDAPKKTASSFVVGSRLLKTRKAVPGRYIVVLDGAAMAREPQEQKTPVRARVEQLAHELSALHAANVGHVYSRSLQGFSAEMTEEAALRLSNDPRVRYVEEDGEASLATTQQNAQWALDRIDHRELQQRDGLYHYSLTGSGVHAYVIDSGILFTHTEFGGRAVPGFSAIADGKGSSDCHGHGTYVASLLGGTTYGAAKGVTLHSVRVVPCGGAITWSQVIAGIDWVTTNHVKPAVATLSLTGEPMQALDDALAASIHAGVFYAVAAGNAKQDACAFSPARLPAAMTVGGSDINDNWSSFSNSNHGPCVDLFAPGASLTGAWGSGGDTLLAGRSGTSAASALVAGVAALFLERHPQATPEQVSSELTGNATPGKLEALPPGSPNLLLYSPTCHGQGPNPPQVVVTSPSSGSALSGTVTLTATATDDEYVSRVEFFLDGRSLGWDATAPYEVTWNSALGGNGPGVLTARVSDTNCNEVESAPVSVTLQNAGIAAFDAAWGAPSCATVGNTCDSAWLLEGRGPIGPELHQPNTVGGSCADGTEAPSSGPVSNTPMLQRIVVSRSDGTAFTAGKEVTVRVTVRASTDVENEALDLYLAPDASNPTWTHLARVLEPYQGAGTSTFSTTYVLPASGRHILRGVYHSRSSTFSACTAEPRADHDDLVIAVGPQEPDSTPPVVSITSPAQGKTLQYALAVTMNASDNFGVDHVELYAGNTLLGTIPYSNANSYRFFWDTRTMPNGAYALTARAYDLAGNVTTSAPVNVTLNNDFVPPQVSFTSPVNGATVRETIQLAGPVRDDRSLSRISFFVDGNYLYDAPYWYTSGSFDVPWNSRMASNGPHVLGVKAYDSAGNASPLSTVNVVVDNDYVLPLVMITSPANGAAVSGAVSVEVAASDDRGVAQVSLYVDDRLIGTDTTAPYTFSWNSADELSGSYTFKATVRDTANNSATSAVVTVQANNPGGARFDPVLKVPRCDAVEALCDTRTLVKGRGTVSSNPELNAPNTLDGCVDGTSGSYYDESIARLLVRREDGTALTAGKRVRIEADVNVYSVSYDVLDLYYTANVSASPAWTYLTSVRPTATGLQRLSAEYVLPDSGQQAIRAVFRGTNIFSLCDGSTTTDRDDLVFAVGPREADTVPPDSVALTAPSDGATVIGTVTVTASVGNDNLGVAAVDFFDGETLIDTDTQPPYSVSWNTRGGPNGSHTLKARARDLAGNAVTSQAVTVTADNDFVAPVVSLTAPAPGARLGTLAVDLTASATDDRGVTRVEFYDGTTLRYTDTLAPYTLRWAPPVSQPGNHTLTARAYDAAGNMTISAPVEVVVVAPEYTLPAVAVTVPGSGAKVGGTVTISVDATDASGVSQVEFFLDGVRLGSVTTAPFGFTWNTRTVANGGHVLSARATDLHGNAATSAEVGVTVDNTAPTVALTSPASGAVLVGGVSLQANAADNESVAQVDFLVDGTVVASDTTAPYSVDWDSGLWVNGNHTLVARARDAANNVTSSTPLTVSTNQPNAAGFDSFSGVPTCGLRSPCDTTGYVRGRHTEEVYSGPGTIFRTCPDGTEALEAQRINRLKLSSVTGTRFTQGQRVRIEVYVNAVDTTTDALDLFFTSDADVYSPTWTYLTTLLPGTAGAQILATEYVLPAGTVQAVRAQFRVGGGNGTACSTGPRDDHDDVVFAVDSGPAVEFSVFSGSTQVRGTITLFATADDPQGVGRVEFYADGTLFSSDSSGSYSYLPSWDSTTVADGLHALSMRAYDSGGLATTSHEIVVRVDNTPPAVAITSPTPGSFVGGTVMIQATASDNQALLRVEFYDGSTLLGTTTSAPHALSWNTVGVADGARTLTVRAHDVAGNVRYSAGVGVTVDNTAPAAAAISAPVQNALVGGIVQVSATASDSRGVARVELYVDGTLIGGDTSAPYTVSWNSATAADGAHLLTVKAYDNAGNARTSPEVGVTTDNTLPDAALTSPAPGALLRGSVMLEATASDSQGVQGVEFYDGATLLGTSYAPPHALSAYLAEGARTLTVRAHDSAGNVRTSAGVGVTVDNTAPATAVSAPAQNARVRGTVQVSATASDNVAVARVELYAGTTLLGTATTAPYSVGWDTTAWAHGAVTLTTKAYDTAGNVTVSAGRAVTVDNAAPTVAITSPANGASFSGLSLSTTIQASASDNVGITQVVFYDGASVLGTDTTAPYSVSWNLLGAARGTHTLTARAYDAAGNVTLSAPISVKVN